MRGLHLRQALKSGKRVYGIGMEGYGQPGWPRYFATNAPVDFVFLDSEHTPQNRETIAWAMNCYAAYGIAPLLRVPDTTPIQASMAMDAGAHGVIVPYIETVEQARGVIGAVKYRPLKGKALTRALEEGIFPSEETKTYLADRNPDATLILMIESGAGIENLADILALGGTDGVLVGPHDLSISLGVPEQYDHPVFVEAMDKITATCTAAGVGVGMHVFFSGVEKAHWWFSRGMNFISYRGDTLFVAGGIRSELGDLRKLLESE